MIYFLIFALLYALLKSASKKSNIARINMNITESARCNTLQKGMSEYDS